MSRLAIVIPAYKAQFFRKTLSSFADQSCKDFTIYIGDDASNDDFQSIVDEFYGNLNIVYKRFDENLGGKDLVAQWERCISLTNNEPWIWLFSDDDYIGPDCVRIFFDEIERSNKFDIYHFNISVVGENDTVIRRTSCFPSIISSKELFVSKESAQLETFVVEYIFSREIYTEVGGFQPFDLAWGSDVATWIKMGKNKGIKTLEGDIVYWRSSSINITPNLNNLMVNKKFLISLDYIVWVNDYFNDNYIKCFNVKYFYRLFFHYSLILDENQLNIILKLAYKNKIIGKWLKLILSNTVCLTRFFKKTKQNISNIWSSGN